MLLNMPIMPVTIIPGKKPREGYSQGLGKELAHTQRPNLSSHLPQK